MGVRTPSSSDCLLKRSELPSPPASFIINPVDSSFSVLNINMCHVIVTCRSMLWTLLSIVVAFAELIAFMSADWLIGKAKTRGSVELDEPGGGPSEPYHPTLGIYARCIRNPGVQHVPRETLCGPYAENFGEIASGFWQATAIFLAVGIFILCMVALVSVFTMCVQSIMKKSIFNVCGLLQGIAGKCTEEGRGPRAGWALLGSAQAFAHLLRVLKTIFCLLRLALRRNVLSKRSALPSPLCLPCFTLL